MHVFEIIIALLLAGAGLAALSRRIGTPYPAMVALAGAALALVTRHADARARPGARTDAVRRARTARRGFRCVTNGTCGRTGALVAGLALGAVALTIVVVAVAVRLLVPDMPWAAAIALGAIVAPPDAAAATAVLKQLRPPHRLLVILEGESLFNDASALLVYRLAVAATLVGALSPASVVPTLLIVTVGSLGPRIRAVARDAGREHADQRCRHRRRRAVLRDVRAVCGCSPSGCTSPVFSPSSSSRW
jgi:CPA1 family monovalent cation:H+ antiporter